MFFTSWRKRFRFSSNFWNASNNAIEFNANIIIHDESRFVSAPFEVTVGTEA